MTRFTLICPTCESEVTLPVRRLLVRADEEQASGEVLFTCLMCYRSVTVPVDEASLTALAAAGATFVPLAAPAERHPETAQDGPPLTHDDLIDLHVALADDHWFDRLLVTDL